MALTEKQYLTQQADDARDAIRQIMSRMGKDLSAVADPRTWTAQYPWAGLVGATAAGFALAATVTPRRQQSIKEKLGEIRDQLASVTQKFSGNAKPKRKRSLGSRLLRSGLGSLRSALTHSLTAAIAGKAAGSDEHPHNGHPAEAQPM